MIITDDLTVGDTILYPVQQPDGSVRNEGRTVSYIVEYPANRVLYFEQGGYGVSDRRARHIAVAVTR